MAKMAKSLKYIMLALTFVFVFVFAFTGCGSGMEKFETGPNEDDVVTGNGSLAVTKGDYMYFVNGYTACENTDVSNYNQTVTYGALYRVKLLNGFPEKDYDEESEDYDGSRKIKDVDILVKKVVGFESMGLYIFGDYIYFTSPSTDVDENLKIQNKKVMFYRTKIDRSTAPEFIYTTESDGENVSFNMLQNGDDIFLMILDGTNLKIVKYSQSVRKSDATYKNVSSVAFARYSTAGDVSEFNKDVYYTRTIQEEDEGLANGNIVCRYNLDESKNYDKVLADDKTSITFKFASKDSVFYEKTLSDSTMTDNKAKFCAVSNIAKINDETAETEISAIPYSDYALISGTRVVVNSGSAIILKSTNETLYSGSATIIGVYGDYVYLFDTSANTIKRVSLVNKEDGAYVTQTVIEKAKTSSKNCATVYDNKVIYLSTDQTNDSVYLHMVDLINDNEDHFVGVLEKKDYDKTESDE